FSVLFCLWFVFFFQAEDGIRDRNVTGVQTCALPISLLWKINRYTAIVNWFLCQQYAYHHRTTTSSLNPAINHSICLVIALSLYRSEERRVGRECVSSVE